MRCIAWILCLSLSLPLVAADVAPPAPPLALRAAETPDGVHLNWTAPPDLPDVDGFRVYRSEGGAFTAIAETTATEFLDLEGELGLVPGEGMTYYVTSFNGAGESPPSNMASGSYPYCWDILTSPGQLNLPVGVALHCFWPIPIDDLPCDMVPSANRPTQTRDVPCLA